MLKKKLLLLTSLLFVLCSYSQQPVKNQGSKPTLALKAGMNFSNVTASGSFKTSSRKGFMVGAYFASPSSTALGYRTEIIFSRQGYNYANAGAWGSISQDYLLIPQMLTLTITKRLQFESGAQVGFLLRAKDSGISLSSAPYPYAAARDYFKKISYGLAGGIQIFPFKNLLVGARAAFNIGGMAAEEKSATPPYLPVDKSKLKSYFLQLYIGRKV